MLRKSIFLILALFASLASSGAWANYIESAQVTSDCKGYTIALQATNLVVGTHYTIKWKINGLPEPVKDQVAFVAGTASVKKTVTKTWASYGVSSVGSSSLSGTATLIGHNTVAILFAHKHLSCSICGALGLADNYALLGLENSRIDLSSGPLRIDGNAGIGQNGQFNFSGGGKILGALDADPTAQLKIDGGGTAVQSGIYRPDMQPIESAARALGDYAASLSPTQTFGSITSSTNITGNGGLNVVQINGKVHLSGGGTLVIAGGASDTFIIRVTQGLQLDGGANLILHGVQPGQVLFYFAGSGDQIQTSGKADTAGIFLAPKRDIQINGGFHTSEFISGTRLSFQSNPYVCQACKAEGGSGPGPN